MPAVEKNCISRKGVNSNFSRMGGETFETLEVCVFWYSYRWWISVNLRSRVIIRSISYVCEKHRLNTFIQHTATIRKHLMNSSFYHQTLIVDPHAAICQMIPSTVLSSPVSLKLPELLCSLNQRSHNSPYRAWQCWSHGSKSKCDILASTRGESTATIWALAVILLLAGIHS
jgi:hypothetical protein